MKRKRINRRQQTNFVPKIDVESWIKDNPEALISCPHQPGNLKLTKAACAKRHMTANEPRYANIGAEPFHVFVFKMNLVACRNCEIGAGLVGEKASESQVA